jgi:hypothetical protein
MKTTVARVTLIQTKTGQWAVIQLRFTEIDLVSYSATAAGGESFWSLQPTAKGWPTPMRQPTETRPSQRDRHAT